jgi:hypothetical protein
LIRIQQDNKDHQEVNDLHFGGNYTVLGSSHVVGALFPSDVRFLQSLCHHLRFNLKTSIYTTSEFIS